MLAVSAEFSPKMEEVFSSLPPHAAVAPISARAWDAIVPHKIREEIDSASFVYGHLLINSREINTDEMKNNINTYNGSIELVEYTRNKRILNDYTEISGDLLQSYAVLFLGLVGYTKSVFSRKRYLSARPVCFLYTINPVSGSVRFIHKFSVYRIDEERIIKIDNRTYDNDERPAVLVTMNRIQPNLH